MLILKDPKTEEQFQYSYDIEDFYAQCGMRVLSELVVYISNKDGSCGAFLKEQPKVAEKAFKLLDRFLFDNDVSLIHGTMYMHNSPLFNDEYEDKPVCGRVIMSDVVENRSPYMTGMFAQYLKLPHGEPIQNPNTRHMVNHWWYDMPVKDVYTDISGDDIDDEDY
jgi:hypothetical protein